MGNTSNLQALRVQAYGLVRNVESLLKEDSLTIEDYLEVYDLLSSLADLYGRLGDSHLTLVLTEDQEGRIVDRRLQVAEPTVRTQELKVRNGTRLPPARVWDLL